MKNIILIILISSSLTSFAQKFRDGDGFDTDFKRINEGTFSGTTNGVLFCELSGQELILDFQGSQANLTIVPEPEEVYDSNTKTYTGTTTSGRTTLKYSTYAWANELTIELNQEQFQITAIDGGCDMVINGVNYYYQSEKETEYLVLIFTANVELNNWQSLLGSTGVDRNISELSKQKRNLIVKENSTITFAIKK